MKFKDASSVSSVIYFMLQQEWSSRAQNRARIASLFNGSPPYTAAEQRQNRIETNFNTLVGPKIIQDARSQFYNAYLKKGKYFTVSVNVGEPHERRRANSLITQHINRPMKRSLAYTECLRSVFAQVCLHGPGPVMWEDKWHWKPDMIGIEDLLIPSNTKLDMSNLDHFARYRRYTWNEIVQKTSGKRVDPGWNMPMVGRINSVLSKEEYSANYTWQDWRFPEKIVESIKENSGYWAADCSPTVNVWDFYFQDPDKGGWMRRMVVDDQSPFSGLSGDTSVPDTFKKDAKGNFLYTSDRVYAESIDRVLHFQFADCSNAAPFHYHTQRSLGYMLYYPCHLFNRMQSRAVDHFFENLMWLFKITGAEDRERIQMVQLTNMGLMPNELDYVKAQDRYQPSSELLAGGLQQMRQLMAENSASFTKNISEGLAREMTATEVIALENKASQNVGAMLNQSFVYQEPQYREICRRFCLKNSPDKDVQEFQRRCREDGIPEEMMNSDHWDIDIERPLGAGNKVLEIAQADKLMSIRPVLDPDAQREVDHIFVEANTDDPKLADRLAPMKPKTVNDASMLASSVVSTLLNGLPVPVKQGINHIDYVETMLGYIQTEIDQLKQMQNEMATPDQILGLETALQHADQHVQIIAQNPAEKQRVAMYGNAMSDMSNEIRAFKQRLEAQMEQQSQEQGGVDPKVMGEIQARQIKAESDAKIKEAAAMQKMGHKDLAFRQRQEQDAAKTQAAIAKADIETQASVLRENSAAQQRAQNERETSE